MKIKNLVKFDWGDALKRTVTCTTVEGRTMIEKVCDLERKAKDKTILAPIRAIYEDMLEWAEKNK